MPQKANSYFARARRPRPHIDDYGIFQINLILISPANMGRVPNRIVYKIAIDFLYSPMSFVFAVVRVLEVIIIITSSTYLELFRSSFIHHTACTSTEVYIILQYTYSTYGTVYTFFIILFSVRAHGKTFARVLAISK